MTETKYGGSEDYNVKDCTDQLLLNLHQDWCLGRSLFGTSCRTERMINALVDELTARNMVSVPYVWIAPKKYEAGEGVK